MIKKTLSYNIYLLSIILVLVAGMGFYLFYSQYAAVAGSPEQELERLFGNMGIIKMAPGAMRLVSSQKNRCLSPLNFQREKA